MTWLWLSLLTALFVSLRHLYIKKSLASADEYVVSWTSRLFTTLILLPALFFDPVSEIGPTFINVLAITTVLSVITTIVYVKALKISQISLSVPFLNLTPVFLIVTSRIMLGESPSSAGALGILLVVFGALLIGTASLGLKNFLSQISTQLLSSGVGLMILVALLYSIWVNLDKIGTLNSSPVFWLVTLNATSTLGLLPFVWLNSSNVKQQVSENFTSLFLIGLLSALFLICQMNAIIIGIVPYVIAIKRTSTLFTVILGVVFLKEAHFRSRILGSLIMVVGAIVISAQ